MYKLTLTKSERAAIDWVGYRYWHGSDFYRVLSRCEWQPDKLDWDDCDWDGDYDITFVIPEKHALVIKEHLLSDSLACFAPELCEKLNKLVEEII